MSPAKRTATRLPLIQQCRVSLQPLDLVPIQAALQTFALLEADLCLH